MTDAIADYNEILRRDSAIAADSQAALETGQEARGLLYSRRPVCLVMRPFFLTPKQFRYLHDRVKVILPAARTIYKLAIAEPGFRKQFRLSESEDSLLEIDPGFEDPAATSRIDAFCVSETQLRFTEFNTEAPAGGAYSDSLTRLFHGIPVFQEFQRLYQVWPVLTRPGILHTLMDAYKQWRGNGSMKPRVAILDSRDAKTFAEFVLFYDYFKVMGIEARIVDPQDLEYRSGKLMAGDFHINLVYKRVPTDALLARGGFDHPLIQAARDRAACIVNSFRARVLSKRAAIAVLSDERNGEHFSEIERQAINEHIPWTRLLEHRKTRFEGKEIDLIPFVAAHKDRFALRPNDARGVEGMVAGWSIEQSAWERALEAALIEPTVVQERVDLPKELFPIFENGQLQFRDQFTETSPFVAFSSFMHGCMTRVASKAPVNVAGGGSVVPTFVVEPR